MLRSVQGGEEDSIIRKPLRQILHLFGMKMECVIRPLILNEEILNELEMGEDDKVEEYKDSYHNDGKEEGKENQWEPATLAEFEEEKKLIELMKLLIEVARISSLLSIAA
ncbi:hypothetical protein RCL_jg7860.t1 [Rhizophagus clarus]|uniref:Uncharacterized protein n=1 Tax=Rhizophagus clarus TaxID=94130 RepID=A0A8H3R547_9GLOM|nr:hypothetical protein RCL_jg7860.t1 [Rhizophagus clarus]